MEQPHRLYAAPAPLDCVIVGAGLAGSLVALALLDRDPAARVVLLERGRSVGGNHTWSFHAGDVPVEASGLVEPLVAHRWPGYDVAFEGFERAVGSPYAAVTSARLDEVVRARFAAAPRAELRTGADATSVGRHHVDLLSGERLRATLVVDARGPRLGQQGPCAYQKFVGLELRLASPAKRALPMLLDARVAQTGGFRFFYTLPLAPDRVLVEDTYYSEGAALDVGAVQAEVLAYAGAQGLKVAAIERREAGVLPLPLVAGAPPDPDGPLAVGFGAGLLHPTTGYSFPVAVRVALHVADAGVEAARGEGWARLCAQHERQAVFFRLLNRLLFQACAPADRHRVLARFYRLPEPTIARFYAMTTTTTDRARIVCGRPPQGLSLRAALAKGLET